MPRIREYTPQSELRNPVDTRRVNTEDLSVGSGLVALGESVSGIERTIQRNKETKDKTNISKRLAETQETFTIDLEERLKQYDGTDTEFSKKFLDDYENHMNELSGEIETNAGRQYFDEARSELRRRFAISASAGQSEKTGAKTVQDFTSSINTSANALVANPTLHDFTSKNLDQMIGGFVQSGMLDATKAEELRIAKNNALGVAAVKGMAKLNPDMAKADLDSGKWDQTLAPKSKELLYGEIEQEKRSIEIQKSKMEADQKAALKERQQADYDNLLQLHSLGRLSNNDILNSSLDGSEKRILMGMVKRTVKSPSTLKTNSDKVARVFDRIHAPDGDPNKIANEAQLNDLFAKGGMSVADLKFFRGELSKLKTEEGKRESMLKSSAMSYAKAAIISGPGPKDPEAHKNYLAFQQEYWKQYDAGIKAGKTPAELTSPDFVAGVARPFIRTPKQKLQSKLGQYKKYEQKASGKTPEQKMKMMDEILKRKGL